MLVEETKHEKPLKEFNPHVVIVWQHTAVDAQVAAKEFSYKEEAETKYEECVQLGAVFDKVTLAKVVKSHGQG